MAEMFSEQRETFQLLVCNFLKELCAFCSPDCTINHVEKALWMLPALTTTDSSHTQPCHWFQWWHKNFLRGSNSGSEAKLVTNQAVVGC